MKHAILAAALMAAATPAMSDPMQIDAATDPFLDRLPKSKAQLDDMWNAFVSANKGAREKIGDGADVWRVNDLAHNEAEEAAWFTPPIFPVSRRAIGWIGHGWYLTVRDNGTVVESKGSGEQHTIRKGW